LTTCSKSTATDIATCLQIYVKRQQSQLFPSLLQIPIIQGLRWETVGMTSLVIGKSETLKGPELIQKISELVNRRVKPKSKEDWLAAANHLNIEVVDSTELESILRDIIKGLDEAYSQEQEPQLPPLLDESGSPSRAALKRIYRGLTKTNYCFIFGQVEHDVSSEYTDVEGDSYGYNLQVTSCKAFNDSGVGTNVVFYRTSKSRESLRKVFYASATVEAIEKLPDDRFKAIFNNYSLFDTPISKSDVDIAGWNAQNAMEEIDFTTFSQFLSSGFIEVSTDRGNYLPNDDSSLSTSRPNSGATPKLPPSPYSEPVIVKSTWNSIPSERVPLSNISEITKPDITFRDGNKSEMLTRLGAPINYGAGDTNKFAEKRAIHVVKTYFDVHGWQLKRDRQLDGCGYDLEFVKADQELHVEVKGIKGRNITFNLTELEWQRVLDDELFVVATVTEVLKSETENLSFINRAEIAAAKRRILQFRIEI
jgi:hypothetical protein